MKSVVALSLLTLFLYADSTVPPKPEEISITVYNNDLAFIHERRKTTVEKGEQKIIYEGVPSKVITQSVIPSFGGGTVKLYSQNYIYNLISLDSLLEKSIGQTVSFYSNDKIPRRDHGLLLSAKPSVIVKSNSDGKIHTLNNPTQVVFDEIPSSMITKPSLVWHLKSLQKTELQINLKYLSRGIEWKSDYVLNLHKKRFDLTGWITISNNSGASYHNATINCVAGELHRITPPIRYTRKVQAEAMAVNALPVKEESFAGYHLYKIPFKESIRDKEQKQILFIEKKGIIYKQYGKAINSYFENYGMQKLQFDHIVTFVNTKQNGLGIPLPAGTVRLYQNDSNGKTHYIGKDRLGNKPVREKIRLTVGRLFDVVGKKKITKYESDRHHRAVETTYEIRNQSKKAQIVKIEERIPTYGHKVTLHSSCHDNCKEEKKSAFVREFTITLKAKTKYCFNTGFEVVYE